MTEKMLYIEKKSQI